MASVLYNKIMNASALGDVAFDTATFKVMLVGAAYVPNRKTHNFRSDVTSEVVGTGYAAGGISIAAVVTRDDATDQTLVTYSDATWPGATLSGVRAAVIYVSHGGLATADELVAYVDFGSDKSVAGDAFVFKPTSPLRITNAS